MPQSLAGELGELCSPPGSNASVGALPAVVVGLYFSAQWCAPCRAFTPILVERYAALKKAGKQLELVLVSSDRNEQAFEEYHACMPWPAIAFACPERKAKLAERYGVTSLPTLVFVKSTDGSLINKEGREAVLASSFVEDFPFHPRSVHDISNSINSGAIETDVSLLVLMEGADAAEQEAASSALRSVAEVELKKLEPSRAVQRFYTGKGGGPVARLRNLCGLPSLPVAHEHALVEAEGLNFYCDGCGCNGFEVEGHFACKENDGACHFDLCAHCHKMSGRTAIAAHATPVMLILDVGDGGAFYEPEVGGSQAVTSETLSAFVQAFRQKKLSRKIFGEASELDREATERKASF